MDEAMTHDRCSELLLGYVRGELPSALSDEVRAHLAGCSDCRAEEKAVAALTVTADDDSTPLDDMERARLHRGLAQELFTARANADVAGAAPASRGWARWIVPAGTAAAVLAGVLVTTLGGGLGDTGGDAGVAPLSREEGPAEGGGGDAVSPRDRVADEDNRRNHVTAHSGEAAESQTTFAGPEAPDPVFDPDAGTLTASDLSDIGRPVFEAFAAAYRPGDGARVYDGFLAALAREDAGVRPQIEECAATLPQDGSLIPAYAAVGEYEGHRALVLGFVTSDPGSRRLDRYLVSVWDLEECAQPVDTVFERI
jgi:hypothetical protein